MKQLETLFLFIVLMTAAVLASGCVSTEEPESMNRTTVKAGDHVQVDYIGRLEDGTVFDTSIKDVATEAGMYNSNRDYQPLGFTVGRGEMIPGFDKGVVGMVVGEEKTLTIPPEKAYGNYRDDLLTSHPIEELRSAGITPEVGTKIRTGQGQIGTITNVTDTEVVVDFNHELAGKTLIFNVTLVFIG